MPTIRARHTLTETPELAQALDDAAVIWPELRDDRAALLRRLVEAGRQSVGESARKLVEQRRRAIAAAAGAATGAYEPGERDALRGDWPA